MKDKDFLDKVHRRGMRFVGNNYLRDSGMTDMLESLGWDSLESMMQILNQHDGQNSWWHGDDQL